MNAKTAITTILAICLSTAGIALAQSRGDRNEHGRHEQGDRYDRQDRRDADGRRPQRGDFPGRPGNVYADGRWDRRGGDSYHGFYRGGRLPDEYRHRNYVVDDWRGHSLRQPPRGHRWVQVGGEYVLVAVATGIILEILLNP